MTDRFTTCNRNWATRLVRTETQLCWGNQRGQSTLGMDHCQPKILLCVITKTA